MYLKNAVTGKMRGPLDTVEFEDGFPGTAINTGKWLATVSTMALAVASGFVQLNSAGVFAVGNVARIQTAKFFTFIAAMARFAKFSFRFGAAPAPAGSVTEVGFFIATGVAAPTLGAFFRLTPANGLQAVVNFNGVETALSCLARDASPWPVDTAAHVAWISYDDDAVDFWIDGNQVCSIPTESQISARTSSAMPFSARVYYASAGAVAQKLDIGQVVTYTCDNESSKPWAHIMAGMGHHGYQGQSGGTMGSLAKIVNSTNPGAAVPTNTTAALGTGLGGEFWETDTLAIGTDGIVSSWQNPAGTVDQPGKTFYCTGVKVSSFVQTALVAGGANEVWSIAFGHTNVSLATTESAVTGAKAPRRVALGTRLKAAALAVLSQLTDLSADFSSAPIVVNPGEFFQVVKKNVGTVGTGGVIAHDILVLGYFE